MGAIHQKKFDIEFIDRTQNIIKEYKGIYNITLLLNCLLGLVVLPSEYYRRKTYKFFDKDISEYPKLNKLTSEISFTPTKYNYKTKQHENDKTTLKNLIKKVRNGISHQHIECVDKKGKWTGVTIRDFNTRNGNKQELEIKWTPKQLKEFALFVADSYKSEINKISV